MGREYREVATIGSPSLQVDEALNDSDKVLTVPSQRVWEILWVWIEFTASATVGTRRLEMQARDGSDDIIARFSSAISITASSAFQFLFLPDLPGSAVSTHQAPFIVGTPRLYLPAGFDVRILDSTVVDAAADDMIIQMMVNEITEEPET